MKNIITGSIFLLVGLGLLAMAFLMDLDLGYAGGALLRPWVPDAQFWAS